MSLHRSFRFRAHEEAAEVSTRRLLALFALVLVALVLAVNGVLALAYRLSVPFLHGYPAHFFATNTGLVLLFVLGGCWFESLRLRDGGAHVAKMAGGRPASTSGFAAAERLERRFVNVVNEMAIASRWPAPAAWVLASDDAINAFAAGWRADDAVIAVTRGALERLTRAELQGVVAHEFSHLVHGDTRLNMRLIGLVWGLQMLFTFGRMLAAPSDDGRRPASTLFGLALMAVGALGWAAGRLLQAAVSRQREFLADASAVKYTRVVDGIGGALRKIAAQARENADALRGAQTASLAHLLLHRRVRRSAWWSTHPPVAERLRRLYGVDPGPLAADPLPAPVDEDAAPVARIAPAVPLGRREAERFDALQNPALAGAAEREREALQRIDRWHGPGEREAALLALVLSPRSDAEWQAAIGHLGVAPAVRREIEALGLRARLDVLALVARRSRADARVLLARCAAGARTPLQRLRWLLLRHWLRKSKPAGRLGVAALQRDVLRASASFARLLGAADTATWQRVCSALSLPAFAQPADERSGLRAALRVQRRLAPMQRPLLWRAWYDATVPHDAARHEMLALAALLLDLPLVEPVDQGRSL